MIGRGWIRHNSGHGWEDSGSDSEKRWWHTKYQLSTLYYLYSILFQAWKRAPDSECLRAYTDFWLMTVLGYRGKSKRLGDSPKRLGDYLVAV